MPAWGQSLTENQVGALVAYIRELQSGTTDVQAVVAQCWEDQTPLIVNRRPTNIEPRINTPYQ